MPDSEKLMDVPLGSVGGPEYVQQEREAALQLLKQRIAKANTTLDEAIASEETSFKNARIKEAQDTLTSAIEDFMKAA